MAEEQSTEAKNQVSQRQQIILAEAKKAAKAQGLDWRAMSKDERRKLRTVVRALLIAHKELPPEKK